MQIPFLAPCFLHPWSFALTQNSQRSSFSKGIQFSHRISLFLVFCPSPGQDWCRGWSRKDKQEAPSGGTIIPFNPHQTPLIPLVFSISSLPLLKKLMSHKDKADNELFIGKIMGWGCNLLVLLEKNISILEHHKMLGFNNTFCVVRDGFMNRLCSWTLSESSWQQVDLFRLRLGSVSVLPCALFLGKLRKKLCVLFPGAGDFWFNSSLASAFIC